MPRDWITLGYDILQSEDIGMFEVWCASTPLQLARIFYPRHLHNSRMTCGSISTVLLRVMQAGDSSAKLDQPKLCCCGGGAAVYAWRGN